MDDVAGKSSASDRIGAAVRRLRRERKWTVAQLAERCAAVGADKLTAAAITNIELRERRVGLRSARKVTIDELFALASALSVPPSALMPELTAPREPVPDPAVIRALDDQIGHLVLLRARMQAHHDLSVGA